MQATQIKGKEQVRPLGFAVSESGLLMVVDPTALIPYLKEGVMEDWIARTLVVLGDGAYEVPLGECGGEAVMVPGTIRGRHVLAKERLNDGALELDQNVRDAA